jgi:predicted RNA-binding protein YlxR (DUF448 family)
MVRKKHIPQRMCVACRRSQDKRTLIRVVRTPGGVLVDETGKLPGRGAYLHADGECWEKGLKASLEKALNTSISDSDRQKLLEYWENYCDQDDSVGNQTKR